MFRARVHTWPDLITARAMHDTERGMDASEIGVADVLLSSAPHLHVKQFEARRGGALPSPRFTGF